MTGADALLLARRAIVLALAEQRLAAAAAELKAAGNDEQAAALARRHHHSAACSVAGYRRGYAADVRRILAGGVNLPGLKPLGWQIQRGDAPITKT